MQKQICEVNNLGLVPYTPVWRLQEKLAAEIASGSKHATLLLMEHSHTYTFGRRGNAKNLVWSEDELTRRGIDVQWVDRGGDITYHGPGQLVGYPLVPLDTANLQIDPSNNSSRLPQADYIGYLRKLEQTIIQTLAEFGIKGRAISGLTGVWVNSAGKSFSKISVDEHGQPIAKIAAIGVKVDAKGITRHGFALNVNPDMSYWEGIIACGLDGYEISSLSHLLPSEPPMQRVIDTIVKSFGQVFNYRMLSAENPIVI